MLLITPKTYELYRRLRLNPLRGGDPELIAGFLIDFEREFMRFPRIERLSIIGKAIHCTQPKIAKRLGISLRSLVRHSGLRKCDERCDEVLGAVFAQRIARAERNDRRRDMRHGNEYDG